MLEGALNNIMSLTCAESTLNNDESDDEDFVQGYSDFTELCIKPLLLLTIDSQLSFVLSASNLTLFSHNYNTAKMFVTEYPAFEELLSRFNL